MRNNGGFNNSYTGNQRLQNSSISGKKRWAAMSAEQNSGSIKTTQRLEEKECLTVIKCNIQQTTQCHFKFMNSVHFFSELMKLYLCNLNNAFIDGNTHLYTI